MKNSPPINSKVEESVNQHPELVEEAYALGLDEQTIMRLVDIIFSQKDGNAPVS